MITKLVLPLVFTLFPLHAMPTINSSAKISIFVEGASSPITASCSSDFEMIAGETREQIAGEGKSGWVAETAHNPATIKVALSFASDDEEAVFKSKLKSGTNIVRLTITETTQSASGNPMIFSAKVGAARVSKVSFGKGSDRTGSLTFICARMNYSKVASSQ